MISNVPLISLIAVSCLLTSSSDSLARQVQEDAGRPGAVDDGLTVARNAIYFELLGTVIAYSLNYERYFNGVSLRVGMEPFRGPAIPILLNYYFDKDRIELGAGLIWLPSRHFPYTTIDSQQKSILWTAAMGYRYQPREGGLVFRMTLTLLFEKKTLPEVGLLPSLSSGGPESVPLIPWLGFSLGYAF